MMRTLSKQMGNRGPSTRVEIHLVVYTFVSTMRHTRKDARKQRCLSTIGQSFATSGKQWKKKRRPKSMANWWRKWCSRSWTSQMLLGHTSLLGKGSSVQSQSSSQLTIKLAISFDFDCWQKPETYSSHSHLLITLRFEIVLSRWGQNQPCMTFQAPMTSRFSFTTSSWSIWKGWRKS